MAVGWQCRSVAALETIKLHSLQLKGQDEGLKSGKAMRIAEKGTQTGWVVAHTSNPSPLEVEVGRSRVRCHP